MKTLFITVGETPVLRNLLRGQFWKIMTSHANLRIVIITTPDKEERFRTELEKGNIFVKSIAPQKDTFFESILSFISRAALKTSTVTYIQMRETPKNVRGRISLFIKRFLWYVLGRSKILQRSVRRMMLWNRPASDVQKLFNEYKPDTLFTTISINVRADLPMLCEAKRRGIKTIGMVRGWDNFTSHGFLRVVPDVFLLQNEYLRNVGIKYQFLNPQTLHVVGFPQYDLYFDQTLREPREAFLNRLGIDPNKKVILYGAMGDFLFPKEGEIAEAFEELVEEKKIPGDLMMVFRAHPAFETKMKNLKHVIPDRKIVYPQGALNDWDMGRAEVAHLINSIIHSEMVANAGSTIALDAIALGKPAISITFEKTKVPYWFSSKRFRDAYTHYEDLMPLGGIAAVESKEELAEVINRYLKNPQADAEGRERVKKEFFSPFDGKVGERIAKAVLAQVEKA